MSADFEKINIAHYYGQIKARPIPTATTEGVKKVLQQLSIFTKKDLYPVIILSKKAYRKITKGEGAL